ncbi:protein of unknown function [Methylocella tundrae]|uniref:Uncharacterized protein n=1 Tax=Methylocella tundrae TaxID=227605 RepID=A0A4U8Z5K4_METTU|nr:protein of unknown function [Methylocella tundrae]
MPRDYSCGAFWRKGGKPKDDSAEPPAGGGRNRETYYGWPVRARRRDLRERFGDDQAVKRRSYRWTERGALDKCLEALTALHVSSDPAPSTCIAATALLMARRLMQGLTRQRHLR